MWYWAISEPVAGLPETKGVTMSTRRGFIKGICALIGAAVASRVVGSDTAQLADSLAMDGKVTVEMDESGIVFKRNEEEQLRIHPDGNVGVGTRPDSSAMCRRRSRHLLGGVAAHHTWASPKWGNLPHLGT